VNARDRLEAILTAAIRAVDAGPAVARVLPARLGRSNSPLVVLALGKAACAMAAPVEAAFADRIRAGLAVTKDGHQTDSHVLQMDVRETAHPVPDARCERAAREALALARGTARNETLVVLLSGGASSLTACPARGLDLSDLARTTRALLACGADIQQLNCVRKHLSDFAGGRLARAAGAGRVEVLVVSDVPGDALDTIGSGPCAPDPTTFADALEVIDRGGIRKRVPASVLAHLAAGASGALAETPKPDDPVFERVQHTIVARNKDAREAAEAEARCHGLEPVALGECLAGEAREQALRLVEHARGLGHGGARCLVAGGETTVTLRGGGRGGRNQELALAAALALAGYPDAQITLLAAGTDGSDGPTDAAGACVDPGSVARGAARGVDARAALEANDSYTFFEREGGLVVTGPTGTNVMDLVLAEVR
jgi:glycerate-2-kinase